MKQKLDKRFLEERFGIVLPGVVDYLDTSIAMDAQPTLITTSNAGIPAYLANYLDPEMIRVLVTPMNAAKIIGEQKKGDWTTDSAQFPVIEATGEVSAYGDWNENGNANANANWVARQSFLFQTITQWGELELEKAGLAKINYAAEQNIASTLVLAKAMNKSHFFGIANLKNYGLLNDPALSTPIAPLPTGTSGGTLWSTKDGAAVYGDIQALYTQLQTQMRGLITREEPMVLALSPEMETNFTKTNQYNVNVSDQLKKNFPRLRIETAVEYNTTGGQLVQLMAETVDGKKVAFAGFNEKLRAHPVKVGLSSFKQKKTSGTWGAVIRYPVAIAGLLGV